MRKVLFSRIVMCLAIVSFAVGCKDYDDDIDALNNRVTELQTNLEGQLATKVTALEATIQSTKEALEAADTDLQANIDATQAALDAAIANSATKAELEAAQAAAVEARAKLATKIELGVLQDSLVSLKAVVSELKTNVEANASSIEANTITINGNTLSIVELTGVVSALSAKVDNYILQTDAKLDLLDVKYDNLDAALQALKTQEELDVLELKDSIISSIAAAQYANNMLEAAVDLKISVLDTKVTEGLAKNAQALTDSVASIDAKILDLNIQIAELRNSTYTKDEIDAKILELTTAFDSALNEIQDEIDDLRSSVSSAIQTLYDTLMFLANKVDETWRNRITSLEFAGSYINGIEALNFDVIEYGSTDVSYASKEVDAFYHVNPGTVVDSGVVLGANGGWMTLYNRTNEDTRSGIANDEKFFVNVKGVSDALLTVGIRPNSSVLANIPAAEFDVYGIEQLLQFTISVRHSQYAMLNVLATSENPITIEGQTFNQASYVTSEEVRFNKTVKGIDIVRPLDASVIAYDNDMLSAEGRSVSDALVINLEASTSTDTYTCNLLDSVAPLVSTDLLALNFNEQMTKEELAKYGLKFQFDLTDGTNPLEFEVNTKDQQKYINLSNADMGTISSHNVSTTDLAIGKTPIVRVSIIDTTNSNALVTEAYIKVAFVAANIVYTANFDDLLECPEDIATEIEMTTPLAGMTTDIYEKTGLTVAQFTSTYSSSSTEFYVNDVLTPILGSLSSIDATTGVITWSMTEAQLRAAILSVPAVLTSGDELKVVLTLVDPLGVYPTVMINFITKWTAPDNNFNIAASSLLANLWDLDNTSITHHTANPSNTETDPNACTYVNNIFDTFDQNNFPSGLVDSPMFEFKAEQDAITIGSDIYTFSVSTDGKTLSVQKNGGASEVVATMGQPALATTTYNQIVTYSENANAKALLNSGVMLAKVVVVAKNCLAQDVIVKVNSQDYFTINFVRPVNISAISDQNILDAANFGSADQIIALDKLAHLYDWRQGLGGTFEALSNFANHDNYYDYYGVGTDAISIDAANITTNLNQADDHFVLLSSVTNACHITLYPASVAVGGTYTLTAITAGGGTATASLTDYPRGLVAYNSNGTGITKDFTLRIPVTVTYKWGTTTSMVTVIVKK